MKLREGEVEVDEGWKVGTENKEEETDKKEEEIASALKGIQLTLYLVSCGL